MQRVMDVLDRVEAALCQGLLLVIVGLVFVSALLRYIGYPVNWTNALASGLFVWLIYIGADRALRRNRHIGMSSFVDKLPQKAKHTIEIGVTFLIFFFLLVIAYLGVRMVLANTGRVFEEIFFLSYSVVVAAIPVGTGLMCLTLLTRILTKVRG
ncbi:MAG: TRAP transporter small permease [Candidatus Caldatribacterium sp.]|uniref:TRAP transporter small permease n=1 Tax=Candidatus Caldatribacterium sp. TaxID=2282143 RepID=UPI002999DDE0|nr:TRAP transporter small permease [Candidatus Caldatribacterium sp.]MCX7730203.1 TRAP transporter small permease [Candidatus Caldatribacterium sp.]MDW8081581.1 TRAP transporter small permease [Candidatus Calescibacterium sp.]